MSDFEIDLDFGDSGYSTPASRRLGCGSIFLTVTFLLLVAGVWIFTHRRQVEILVIVVGAVAALYLARGPILRLVQFRRPERLDPTAMPVPLASLQPGKATHTAGLVGLGTEPRHAPLGAPPCVWYRIVIEPVDHAGVTLFEARSSDEIVLEDGMGAKVIVRLEGARWFVRRRHEISSSPEAPEPSVAAYLAERGVALDQPVRACVEWIAPHELVFVRGVVRPAQGSQGSQGSQGAAGDYRSSDQSAAAPLEIAATPQHPVFLALQAMGARARPTAS